MAKTKPQTPPAPTPAAPPTSPASPTAPPATQPSTSDADTPVADPPVRASHSAQAAPLSDEPSEAEWLSTLPEDLRRQPGAALLAEACLLYGLNPEAEANELAGWRYYQGNPRGVTPLDRMDRVVIVTHGGLKLAHPMDARTQRTLEGVFGLLSTDKQTGQVAALPLPDDITLPAEAKDGIVRSNAHVLAGGYLNAKAESARRAARARARSGVR